MLEINVIIVNGYVESQEIVWDYKNINLNTIIDNTNCIFNLYENTKKYIAQIKTNKTLKEHIEEHISCGDLTSIKSASSLEVI